MSLLQEVLKYHNLYELNFKDDKIYVLHFFDESRYADYLNGKSCWIGQGIFNINEEIEFNKIKDNTIVIIKNNDVETKRYKYEPIFKATMKYKIQIDNKKTSYKDVTFKIRKNKYDTMINLLIYNDSLNFTNIESVKTYLYEHYGSYILTDWSVYVG